MGYDESVVFLVRETLVLVLKIVGPVLAAGILIGLLISLFQTITSIQDQTLTMVPKIVGMVVVAVVLLPWMAAKLADYAAEIFLLF